MDVALAEARAAAADGEVPVGLLRGARRRVIARTHNRTLADHDPPPTPRCWQSGRRPRRSAPNASPTAISMSRWSPCAMVRWRAGARPHPPALLRRRRSQGRRGRQRRAVLRRADLPPSAGGLWRHRRAGGGGTVAWILSRNGGRSSSFLVARMERSVIRGRFMQTAPTAPGFRCAPSGYESHPATPPASPSARSSRLPRGAGWSSPGKNRASGTSHVGPHQQVGRFVLELLVDDRARHHQHGGVGDSMALGRPSSRRSAGPRCRRHDDVGAPAQQVERQRICGAAVDQHALAEAAPAA